MSAEETVHLEEQIDELEAAFPRVKDFVLYGGCELSARLDIARSVTRRQSGDFAKWHRITGRCKSDAVCEQTCGLSVCRSKVCRSSVRKYRGRKAAGDSDPEYDEEFLRQRPYIRKSTGIRPFGFYIKQ